MAGHPHTGTTASYCTITKCGRTSFWKDNPSYLPWLIAQQFHEIVRCGRQRESRSPYQHDGRGRQGFDHRDRGDRLLDKRKLGELHWHHRKKVAVQQGENDAERRLGLYQQTGRRKV